MNLSVTGFGACMIAGYPYSVTTGFLYQAIQQLHQRGEFKLTFDIVAMGGFPAHRARKYLAKKVLSNRPDIVVLQFGSTDASAPLRNNSLSRQQAAKTPRVTEKVSTCMPALGDIMKWKLRSLASDVLRVPPLVPQDIYLEAVVGMVNECRAAGSKVVAISPFVMGGGRSDRFARRYTRSLRERLSGTSGVYFLDAHAFLSRWPTRQMLLRDGFHLSPDAHQKLGTALAEAIVGIARPGS